MIHRLLGGTWKSFLLMTGALTTTILGYQKYQENEKNRKLLLEAASKNYFYLKLLGITSVALLLYIKKLKNLKQNIKKCKKK